MLHNRSLYCRWLAVGVALSIALLVTPRARAAEKIGNSLDLVPADASFYSASLRMKEQLDMVLGSKAWARLMEMPAVKMALGMAKSELEKPGGPKAQWDSFMENPDNQRLVALLQEMGSQEFFIYGDKRFADWLGLTLEAINAAQYAPAFNKLAGGDADANDQQVAVMALLETLNDNLDRLVVPDVVIGFKISDPAKADLQIRRLETLINVVIQLLTINEFKDRFGRISVGGTDFVELRLDGRLVPWEELPFDQYAENPGDYEALKQHLRSLKLTIDLGVKDGYLLFSLGDSNEHLVNLGNGDLLVNRPEMKPLREELKSLLADPPRRVPGSGTPAKRLVGVGYASKELNSLITGTKQDVEGLVDLARELVPYAEIDEELEKQILADVEALAKDISPFIPAPGASMSFSYLTPRGYESYQYDWTQNLTLDATKPLTLVNHVGGSPLFALFGRGQYRPQDYDVLVKWIKKGYGYFETAGLPQMPAEEQEKFRQVAALAIPLIKRIDAATRDDLIPALADSQAGLVIDADITSMRWHRELPALGKPLPMAEVALVFGVSDAERLKKAGREYLAVARDAVAKVREVNPDAQIPPDFQVPSPQVRETSAGQVYWYQIPAEAGADPQLQPAAGVGKSVAVLSTSIKQVERILAPTPLATQSNVLAEQKTAGAALHFDFAGTIDALRPWVELAIAHYDSENESENKPDAKFIIEQVRAGAEILKCYRGTTSVSYSQDGATVTHRESIFEDVK
jgi:hypothetical protein